MKLMSRGDAEALVDLLLEDLPIQVLRIVSTGPPLGLTEGEITRIIERSIPRCEDSLNVHGRVRATLSWMMEQGDVDAAGSHRFVRVPPYAIHHIAGDEVTIQLFGDDHLDDVIRREIRLLGYTLRIERVLAESGESEITNPFLQVIRRTLTAPASVTENLLKRLSELGVNHRNMDELERSLPGIDGLVMLPKQAYVSTPPSWGIWHRYDAYLPEGKRWAPIPSWETAEPGLLRWVQALDRRGYFHSRYFWHDRKPKLAELSRSFALLWTYRLDNDAGRSAVVYADGHELWLPLEVLSEHQQWLGLLSAKIERDYSFTHYTLNRPAIEIGEQLRRTLGVSVAAKSP